MTYYKAKNLNFHWKSWSLYQIVGTNCINQIVSVRNLNLSSKGNMDLSNRKLTNDLEKLYFQSDDEYYHTVYNIKYGTIVV